jgi:GAF domain-containing protein/HAMP domain-containing protein
MTRRRFIIPLWLRLLIGIGLGMLVLSISTVVVLRVGLYEVGLQSTELFVSGVGAERVEQLSGAIAEARSGLTEFAAAASNQRLFQAMLLGDGVDRAAVNLPTVRPADIARLFRTTLLNPATSVYDFVRLVDREGTVIAQSSLIPGGVLATDVSNEQAYLTAVNADLQGQDRALAVTGRSTEDETAIESIEILRWRDGSVIGYLIARLNFERLILDNLAVEEQDAANFDPLIFLTTTQGAVISLPQDRVAAANARSSLPALRALGGQRGVATFRRAPTQPEIVAFYALLPGTPLGLVVQSEAEVGHLLALSFFDVRTFVIVVGMIALVVILVLLFNLFITPPLNRLRGAAQALASGDFNVPIPDTQRGDEIGLLATTFATMRDSVRNQISEQEARLAERSRDFAATQEIGRFATTQRDLQKLMDSVVALIIERFPNIYHAQIFLLDAERTDAILRASTGEAGAALLARGHRLSVGSVSVVGQATGQGRIVTARDTAASPIHRRNPLLPDTRAELAIPLRVGDVMIGALDVQSKLGNAFTEEQISVLQTMADQIAVAIENARLYEESIRRAAEIEASNRQATLRAWTEFMRDQRSLTIQRQAGVNTDSDLSELRRQAQMQGRIVVGAPTPNGTIPVAVPIILRGQMLGSVEWELPAQGFGEDKIELATDLADRLAVSLDNARLFQESRRAVERERLVNAIAGRLAQQTTLDDLLKTAVREVGQAVRAPAVDIRVGVPNHQTPDS